MSFVSTLSISILNLITKSSLNFWWCRYILMCLMHLLHDSMMVIVLGFFFAKQIQASWIFPKYSTNIFVPFLNIWTWNMIFLTRRRMEISSDVILATCPSLLFLPHFYFNSKIFPVGKYFFKRFYNSGFVRKNFWQHEEKLQILKVWIFPCFALKQIADQKSKQVRWTFLTIHQMLSVSAVRKLTQ